MRAAAICSKQEEESSTRQKKCFKCAAAFSLSILLVAYAAVNSVHPGIEEANGFLIVNSTTAISSKVSNLSPNTSLHDAESLVPPPWMTAYEEFQNGRIVKNSDGTLEYTDEPYLMWTCRVMGSCGGLGDRLNGIVMSLYVAMLTNRTLIVKGWQTPSNMTAFLEPASIRWDLKEPSLPSKMISTVDQRGHPYLAEPCRQHDPQIGIEFQNNLMNKEADLAEPCLSEYWNRYGGRQDKYHSLFQIGFQALFRFTPFVDKSANHLLQRAGMNDAANDPYVAIHFRTGQGGTWDDPVRHGTSEDLHRFYDCAVKIQTGMKQRYQMTTLPNIYIAADNNTAKEKIMSWNVDGTVKAVTDLEVFHIDRTRIKELNDFDQAYTDVWGELKVLIDATCLVMSRSGFSNLASEISPQQPRCAIMFNECGDANVTEALNHLR
jgi:hypothetical protein